MAKAKKSTKKFVSTNRLKKTIQQRKHVQKIKGQQRQKEDRRRQRVATTAEEQAYVKNQREESGADLEETSSTKLADQKVAVLAGDEEMSLSDNSDESFREESDASCSNDESQEEEGAEDDDISEPISDNEDDQEIEELDEDALDREIQQHKKELEKLKEQDPEFFEYLSKNNQELLRFGEQQDEPLEGDAMIEDEEGEDEGENDAEHAEEDDDEMDQDASGNALTMELWNSWKQAVEKDHSQKSLRKVVMAFKTAVMSNQSDHQDQDQADRLQIEEEAVYGQVISGSIGLIARAFHQTLGVARLAEGETVKKYYACASLLTSIYTFIDDRLPTSYAKWKKVQGMVKTYCRSITELLKQLTEKTMTEFVLRELEQNQAVVYFACFSKLKICREFLKALLHIWSNAPTSVSSKDKAKTPEEMEKRELEQQKSVTVEASRILAFLSIRRLAMLAPHPFIETALKTSYLTFVSASRQYNLYTAPVLQFMMNCMVELHALDPQSSYQHSFVYIRQLAIQLRNALTQQTPETTRALLNWQVVCCIRLWCRILGHLCDSTTATTATRSVELRQLIFPLTQVALGIAKFLPTAQYYPLRFHILRAVDELGRRTETFIPLSSLYMDIVRDLVLSQQKPKPSTLKPLVFAYYVRTPKQYLQTRVFLDGVVDVVFQQWLDHFAHLSTSIAFPEMVVPTLVHLKQLQRQCKYVKLSKAIASMVEKVQESRQWLGKMRGSTVAFAPLDLNKAKAFSKSEQVLGQTPLQKYQSSWRKMQQRVGK